MKKGATLTLLNDDGADPRKKYTRNARSGGNVYVVQFEEDTARDTPSRMEDYLTHHLGGLPLPLTRLEREGVRVRVCAHERLDSLV